MNQQSKLIFGNWKMQLTVKESVRFAEALKVYEPNPKLTVGVFPSFAAIDRVRDALGDIPVILGAQDCFWEEKGPYTGEVSPSELINLGCSHVLVGHSERRMHLGETDLMVQKKIAAAQKAGLTPVFCVGEKYEERAAKQWTTVLTTQVGNGLDGIELSGTEQIVIAYEPVWAIGTGKACDPGEAREAHAFIRSLLVERYGTDRAFRHFRLIYGGSVEPRNIGSFMTDEGIDGALVGGASQKAASFLALLEAAAK